MNAFRILGTRQRPHRRNQVFLEKSLGDLGYGNRNYLRFFLMIQHRYKRKLIGAKYVPKHVSGGGKIKKKKKSGRKIKPRKTSRAKKN